MPRLFTAVTACLVAGGGLLLPLVPTVSAHLAVIRQGAESAASLEGGDRTGQALAAGDFNGDGYDDLAIGAPDEVVNGLADAGAVIIVYGSKDGLTHIGSVFRTAGTIGNTVAAGAHFGHALAAGNFNGDLSPAGRPYDDLAIGAPFDPVGTTARSGRVYVLHGGSGGIGSATFVTLTQGPAGGLTELDDDFGYALTVGSFNGDAYDDLAIGGPGEDSDAGAVFHYYGSNIGLTGAGAGFFKQSDLGGTNVAGDRFGSALASANLYDSSHGDLAVSAPLRSVAGTPFAGVVYLLRGSAAGLVSTAAHSYSAASVDAVIGTDRFGGSLAAGHLRMGDFESLAIGEPNRDVSGNAAAGRVIVVEGSAGGLDFTQKNILTQTGAELEGNDTFGWSVAVGPWDLDDYEDLAVGSQGETIGSAASAGLVQVFTGRATGPSTTFMLRFAQEDLNDVSEISDALGAALVFGIFDNSGRANLAAGAPGEDTSNDIKYNARGVDVEEFTDAGQAFVIAPWRQPSNPLTCRNAVVTDCEGEYVYSLRPFDRVRVASTTKVMTLLIARERSELPPFDPNFVNPVSYYTIPSWLTESDQPGGTRHEFVTAEQWRLQDLMQLMIDMSGNDVAYAIADHLTGGDNDWDGNNTVSAFVDEMNARAAAPDLDMVGSDPAHPRTRFTNPAGLDTGDPWSTPADMAKLMRVAMANPVVKAMLGPACPANNATPCHEFDYLSPLGFAREWSQISDFQYVDQAASQPTSFKPGTTVFAQKPWLYGKDAVGGRVVGGAFGYNLDTSTRALRILDMDALLTLGVNRCGARAALPAGSLSDPGPPSLILSGIPTAQDSARAGGMGLVESEDDSLQIDVAHQSGTGPATLELRIWQGGGTTVPAGQGVPFGIAPFEAHEGIVIANLDTVPVSLRITVNHPPSQQSIVLAPAATVSIPPHSGPRVERFSMLIENLSTGAAAPLDVHERGYRFQLNLASPGAVFSAFLKREGVPGGAAIGIGTTGHDANPGNLVLVAVHSPQYPVGVGEPLPGVSLLRDLHIGTPWPNPFTAQVRIPFGLRRAGEVSLGIYDLQGRRVRRWAGRGYPRGSWAVTWDGRSDGGERVRAGVYLYAFALDGARAASGRLMLVR
ncbi:MAG TPA: hypothetical protein VJY35_04870 [Candidatus Eisenbacteria bacterium]|nr:hypothetical protein [Candidatus Eisenbacteria bacterium]